MILRIIAVAAAFFVGVATPVLAQDKPIELKLSHWVPPSHPLQKSIEAWADAINKASGGSITYKVFPAQQLGKAFDHYDMARDGIADFTYVNPGYQPGRFPVIAAGELPFLIKDGDGGTQALDAWYRKYAAAEMKDVKFCLAFVHDPGAIHSKTKKVVLPEDIKGMKMRPAHATTAALVTLLGGTNVQASAAEIRDLMEKGVADAGFFPWGSTMLFGVDKVSKYHLDVPLYTTTFAWVMNKARYDAMSAGQKKAIDDACTTDTALKFAAEWTKFEFDGRAKVKALAGHETYPLTPEQTALWKTASEPLSKTWADGVKRVGVDAESAMKEFREQLDKYKAAF